MSIVTIVVLFLVVAGGLLLAAGKLLPRYGFYCARKQLGAAGEERERIARDFHDNLAHGLTGVALQLESAILVLDGGPATEPLHNAKAILRTTLVDAKRTLLALRPAGLEGKDFAEALRDMTLRMSGGLPVEIDCRVEGDPRTFVNPRAEDHLYRIAQEAITNALRHAHARRIELALEYGRRSVRLTVRDDGGGAAEAAGGSGTGSGLAGMQERARQIGATFEARASVHGMEIAVEVPR
jgi:signal transduction histidine kinase